MNKACDRLLRNATTIDKLGTQLQHQAIAIGDGNILWAGDEAQLPSCYLESAIEIEDCRQQLITPAFIDCHTHVVYAGDRANEFARRLKGETYEEIARSGGGILSTVQHVRLASEADLIEQSLPRILAMREQGVLTIEIKSGYGLDLDNELKMLRVAKKLGEMANVRVMTTFLGAHALPPEYRHQKQAYIDYLCDEVMPAVVQDNLADAVDVFCERIGFDIEQTRQVFQTAEHLGLPIKCHAEQLSLMGGAELAASYNALSCDHIEYLDERGINAMAHSNSVAVLLPGAYYFLKETKKPPIASLRQVGVGMAIATDCNPGSSPTTSLLLMMNMACQFFSLTIEEAFSAVTWQAARALGLENKIGAIEAGLSADLLRWPVQDAAQLCYYFGHVFVPDRMTAGFWSQSDKTGFTRLP